MPALIIRSVALSAVALIAGPIAAEAAPWQWPLEQGRVAQRFDFTRGDRFRAGAHRTLTLRGAPGAKVRAVCSGVVSFAGRLPDGRRGVTLRCGNLAATQLGLLRFDVRRGEAVVAGRQLGSLGPGRLLSVGARRWSDRDGYRDPLALFGAPPDGLAPAPLAPRGRQAPPPRATRRVSSRAGDGAQPAAPWLLGAAWLGLGISGAAIGAGIALSGRRARLKASAPAAPLAQRLR
ncbi:MAG: M23 family metallopeptidase [Solirubrobacteraceae bacterium]|jgi:hypothetical protein|nr:M23 family metallopeptidase [Solirubrobacteraceae bacterium]